MSLHIQYRPGDCDHVIGNENTLRALSTALEKESPPHTYLFIGPSGCGKTTLARIAARELHCSAIDTIELNAANFRGIETAREIVQQMRLAPLSGKARAWIIDEAHQLTKDGQSALLKALEDTPSHVYFLLATTDPQKLLSTIKNRCTTFEVQLLSEDDIVYLLETIIKKETKEVPDEVLEQIARDSLGSPRAAIVMLDKIIDLPQKRMLRAAAQAVKTDHQIIDLCRILMQGGKWKNITTILVSLSEQKDTEQVRLAILGYFKSVLLKGENDRAFLIMDSFKDPFFNTGFAGLVRACYEAKFK